MLGLAVGRVGCFFTGCCASRSSASRWALWSSNRSVGLRTRPDPTYGVRARLYCRSDRPFGHPPFRLAVRRLFRRRHRRLHPYPPRPAPAARRAPPIQPWCHTRRDRRRAHSGRCPNDGSSVLVEFSRPAPPLCSLLHKSHRLSDVSKGIPIATIARLPLYLRALRLLSERGVQLVSSEELANSTAVRPTKFRKDLSYLGSYGVRGVGYDVDYLTHQISRAMGLTQEWPVILIGIGNLGQALAGYRGFSLRGFQIKALLDADPAKVGTLIGEQRVQHIDQLEKVVGENTNCIAVFAIPESAAQTICDRVVSAGVTSILNFVPTVLQVPRQVEVRKVDLSIELQILAFYEQRKSIQRTELANPA
jgi:redox-sensing transcriptional repressor